MGLFLNIIVLVFEILYYSLFMKFVRKECTFSRYLFLFTIITIIGLIIGTTTLQSYILLVLLIMLGLKYIAKLKVSLYDMLIVVIMIFTNMLIQLPIYIVFYNILSINHFATTMIFEFVKLLLVCLCRDVLKVMYVKLKHLWDNNNFYIRYIFACSMFIYVIITVVLLVKLIWEV